MLESNDTFKTTSSDDETIYSRESFNGFSPVSYRVGTLAVEGVANHDYASAARQIIIPNIRGDKSFADDLNEGQGIVNSRVA